MGQPLIELSKDAQLAVLQSIFRPSAPIDDRRMFLGRETQLSKTLATVQTVGQHGVVYGERGVGKTSLAYMTTEAFLAANGTALSVRLACNADDTFASIWNKFSTSRLTDYRRVAGSGIQGKITIDT